MRPSDNIEKLIGKLRYKTSAATHEKVLGNVLQALDERQQKESGAARPDIWRTIMNTGTRKFAIAAAILFAATLTLYFITGPFSTTGKVYAEVAERLHKARTMIYNVTTSTPVEGMPDMEMIVVFKEPGLMRMTMPGGYVSVMDSVSGKCLSIIPERKQFVEIDMTSLPGDAGRSQLDAIERLRTLPDRADEELGERETGGRKLQGFRVREEGVTNTVWIDTGTRELIEVNVEFANAPGMSATMTGFQFDVDLDDAQFSVNPPAGYSRIGLQVDVSEASEEDLIELLKLWSQWTVDSTLPPTLNPAELAKASMELVKAGKIRDESTSEQDRMQHAMLMTRAMMFVMKLPAESWRYAGENVKYGDASTPIFWYQPAGSQTYRVIYGDLSVKDVAPDDLPK